MDLGCEVSAADNEGNTAWHAAAQSSNVAVLRKLLERGCSSESTNNLNCTALHYAARSGVPLSSLPLATATCFHRMFAAANIRQACLGLSELTF